MTPVATIKPTNKVIQAYYDKLDEYAGLDVTHETGIRTAFIRLLEDTAKAHEWVVITESGQKVQGRTIRPDATLNKLLLLNVAFNNSPKLGNALP